MNILLGACAHKHFLGIRLRNYNLEDNLLLPSRNCRMPAAVDEELVRAFGECAVEVEETDAAVGFRIRT